MSIMMKIKNPHSQYLALGGLLGTSGSNSTGNPKNPLNLSKVTCATWRTLVGNPISIAQSSLLSVLLQATKDLLKRASSNASKDSWSLLCRSPSASSSSQPITIESRSSATDEDGNPHSQPRLLSSFWMCEEEEGEGEEEEGEKCEGEWLGLRTSVMAGNENNLSWIIKNGK